MKDYIGLYTHWIGMMPKPNTEIIKIIKLLLIEKALKRCAHSISIPRTSARGKQSRECYNLRDTLASISGTPMVSKWLYQVCLIKHKGSYLTV